MRGFSLGGVNLFQLEKKRTKKKKKPHAWESVFPRILRVRPAAGL